MQCEKYESTGNDFLIVHAKELSNSNIEVTSESLSDLARRICHRHFGIGADGLLVLDEPGVTRSGFKSYLTHEDAHARMYLVNSDGSHAEMSGNGVRCFAFFAQQHGYGDVVDDVTTLVRVETLAGVKEIVLRKDKEGTIGDVDMGPVTFEAYQIPVHAEDTRNIDHELLGKPRRGVAVNSGVPHWVLFVDSREELEDEDLSHEALLARYDKRFPELTNVSIVYVESRDRVIARVFERGAHETLSCGTGATAIAAALYEKGVVDQSVVVSLRGGELLVTMGENNILSGPVNAVSVCDYSYE